MYLLYAEDGVRLDYAGGDSEEFERRSCLLSAGHAGALTGRRRVGPERWHVRAFFRARPTDDFIARRRHAFPFGFGWQDAPQDEAR